MSPKVLARPAEPPPGDASMKQPADPRGAVGERPSPSDGTDAVTPALGHDADIERSLGSGERYQRQALFFGIGREGQVRIGRARVLIVGCGATGSVLANNLARAGVGYLRIVDRDFVEGNNLQRQ